MLFVWTSGHVTHAACWHSLETPNLSAGSIVNLIIYEAFIAKIIAIIDGYREPVSNAAWDVILFSSGFIQAVM